MTIATTSRLKVNPPLGSLPTLEWRPLAELRIDPAYQRSLETGSSGTLIRRIAQFWDWSLCQPLAVAKRPTGELMVVDGQHRLEAARLRRDIAHLPCVITTFETMGDEAAAFVALNQQRRPLTKINLFRAALAAEDESAAAIARLLAKVGLEVAPHTNYTAWKPAMVSNIAGIMDSYRIQGEAVTELALFAIAKGFAGQVLRYAGTIFPGVYRFVAAEQAAGREVDADQLAAAVASLSQAEWKAAILQEHALTGIRRDVVAKVVVERQYAKAMGASVPVPAPVAAPTRVAPEPIDQGERVWCDQCDRSVAVGKARACPSPFCDARGKVAWGRVA